jgi:hypothetical protein
MASLWPHGILGAIILLLVGYAIGARKPMLIPYLGTG